MIQLDLKKKISRTEDNKFLNFILNNIMDTRYY